jgi:hypothetical protein
VASLSPAFIMNDIYKKTVAKNEIALHLSLSSIFAGGINPFIMLDIKEAEKEAVFFSASGNS